MGNGYPSIWGERIASGVRISGDLNVELGNAKSRTQVRHCHRDECSSQLSFVGITVAGIWSFGHFSHFKGRSEVRDLASVAWPPEGH